MTKYILSVDGGGIRGIIPAMVLAEIEKKARKPISQIFDLMAGTSTGGIVVAGLCKKDTEGKPQYSANDLVGIYREHGAYIFKSSLFRRLLSWFNSARYPCRNIESILDEYFGGDVMKDALSKLMLTSYDIQNNRPFFFKSWELDNTIKLQDALRATTAAPTYFIPHFLKVKQEDRVLIDGGIYVNNPAVCAYASAKKLFPHDEIVLLSIGTGRTYVGIGYNNSKRFGKIKWIQPLLNVMFDSSLDAVNYQLGQIVDDRYIRIQSELTIASTEMDNTTPKNIKDLGREGEEMIKNNQKKIDDFVNSVL